MDTVDVIPCRSGAHHSNCKRKEGCHPPAVAGSESKGQGTLQTRFRKDAPDHAAFLLVLIAVETCGYMGKEAVKFVNHLADIAAESGRVPKGACACWAMQLLLVTVQRGDAEMYCRSGLIISREQGLRYDSGFTVPVLMS